MNNEKMTNEEMLEERIKVFFGGIAKLVGGVLLVTGFIFSIYLYVAAFCIGIVAIQYYIDFTARYVGREAAYLIYTGVAFSDILLLWIISMYNMSKLGKITKSLVWTLAIVTTPYNIGLLIYIVKPLILYLVYLFSS